MRITCIIPCFNEQHELPALLRLLDKAKQLVAEDIEIEMIVADGGSSDGTLAIAQAWPEIKVLQTLKSRAVQMNRAAELSDADYFYFVHADTRPPISCFADIALAARAGHKIGGYPFQFDSFDRLLAFNSWLTRFNVLVTRGGDQSLFVQGGLFRSLGGYDEHMVVMEEYDLLRRARKAGYTYKLLRSARTLVSARKYHDHSWLRVQVANICAMTMWHLDMETPRIKKLYSQILPQGRT